MAIFKILNYVYLYFCVCVYMYMCHGVCVCLGQRTTYGSWIDLRSSGLAASVFPAAPHSWSQMAILFTEL